MLANVAFAKPAARAQRAPVPTRALRCVASAASGEVPDMGKRTLMNGILLGAIGAPLAPLALGFAYFFVPPSCAPAKPLKSAQQRGLACARGVASRHDQHPRVCSQGRWRHGRPCGEGRERRRRDQQGMAEDSPSG